MLWQFYDKWAYSKLHSLVGICFHRMNAVTSFLDIILQHHKTTFCVRDVIFSTLVFLTVTKIRL